MHRGLVAGSVVMFGLIAACGDGGAGGSGAGGGGAGGTGGSEALSTHFGAESQWPTPTNPYEGGYFGVRSVDPFTGTWSLIDMNGDEKLDLVASTASPNGTLQFGHPATPHWLVYLNEGTAFSQSPIEWSTPQTSFDGGYYGTFGAAWETGYWTLVDIDGDKKPDFVFTAPVDPDLDGQQHGMPMAPHWEVYLNTGSGFAASATRWDTPTNPTGAGFFATTGDDYFEAYWALLDLDGDDKPDLVWTAPAGAGETQFGLPDDPHWRVYLNTGTGFSAPMQWSTPAHDEETGLFSIAHSSLTRAWSLLDMDGDGRLDLVSTAPDNGTDGAKQYGHPESPHWKVYRNTGAGFSEEAVDWSTPESDTEEGFVDFGGNDPATGYYTLADMDGDGRPDFVSTAPVNFNGRRKQLGHPERPLWKVHFNTGDGFASSPTDWETPTNNNEDGYFDMDGAFYETGFWTVTDLNGDGFLDFVSTAPANPEGTVQFGQPQSPHWLVSLGTP
jgi:hypothetical protein